MNVGEDEMANNLGLQIIIQTRYSKFKKEFLLFISSN